MKKLILTIAASLCIAGIFGGVSAFAETGATTYPEKSEFLKNLTFTSLVDFAVDGETFAFAETKDNGSQITVYNGETSTVYDTEKTVAKLDCDGGKFYYSADEKSYLLDDNSEADYVFKEESAIIWRDNLMYVFYDGILNIVDLKDQNVQPLDSSFKKVKNYGDTVYALKSNGVYKFSGTSYEEVEIKYYSFETTSALSVGSAAADLKNYALTFIKIKAGTYITEVDLTNLEGTYFEVGETFAVETDTTALLLCNTGNAAIFSIGEKSYITRTSYTSKLENTYLQDATFGGATVTGSRIYASPYVAEGTSALYPAVGQIVKILGKLDNEILDAVYYQVEYTDGDATKIGYVAEGFLTEYIIEDNKKPAEIPDGNYSEKNDVRTVLLILLVIVLVLTAVGYLTYVGTKDKFKKETDPSKTQEEKN